MRINKILLVTSAGIIVLILVGILIVQRQATSDALRVRLTWLHQAQFAGIYLAQDNDIYKNAGLESLGAQTFSI